MGLYHSPNIVRDDLALYLDARNNKSYPDSGNTWFDLSKNNYVGTNTSATYSSDGGGSIFYTGSSQYTKVPDFDNERSLSVFTWIYPTDLTLGDVGGTYYNWLVNKRDNGSDRQWQLHIRNSVVSATFYNGSNGVGSVSDLDSYVSAVSENEWSYVGFTTSGLNGENVISYQNGIQNGVGTLTGDMGLGTREVVIAVPAWAYTSDLKFRGNMATVQIYNKVLTPEEVKQNYDALKGRFQ
jgi:hypothetical protein